MTKKQISIALLVVGVGLVGWGFNLSGTFSSQIFSTFSGRPSDETLGFYIAGGVCIALSLLGLFRR